MRREFTSIHPRERTRMRKPSEEEILAWRARAKSLGLVDDDDGTVILTLVTPLVADTYEKGPEAQESLP